MFARSIEDAALVAWIAGVTLFFSLSSSKLATYSLPVFPHAALLAAVLIRCGTVPFQVGTSMAQAVVSAVDGAFDVFELTLEILDPHLGTLPIECDSVLSFDSPEAAWRWFYEVWVPFQVREEDHSIRAWALSLAASGGGRAGIMPGAFLDLLDELRDEGRLSVEDLEACEQSDRVSIGDIVIEASHDGTPWPGPYVGMHVSLDVPAAEQATEPGPELPNELGERISFEAVEKDGRAGEASFHANDRGWFVQLAFEDDLANVVVSGPHESSDVAHQWLYDWLSAAGDPSDAAAPVKPPKKRPGRPRKAVAVPETSGNISVAPTGEVVLAHPAPNGGGGDVEEQ